MYQIFIFMTNAPVKLFQERSLLSFPDRRKSQFLPISLCYSAIAHHYSCYLTTLYTKYRIADLFKFRNAMLYWSYCCYL